MNKTAYLKVLSAVIIACAPLMFPVTTVPAAYSAELPPRLYAPRLYRNNIYSELYYYEEDKLERYESYRKLHPELAPDEVVWRVNSMLDIPFYSQYEEIKDTGALPLLVNKYNKLPDGYIPKDLVKLPSGRQAASSAAQAFMKLAADARNEGYTIRDVSAYRSYDYQKQLHNRYLSGDIKESVETYSARAGFSEHQTGRAIDVCGPDGVMNRFGYTRESGWLGLNAHKYGFIVRYPKGLEHITGYVHEPWHITYVGVEVSSAMKELKIETLEEYTVKYINHSPNGI